jgi:hypothetical protein
LFSPHADLHLKAVKLAVDHTEYFFNEIRHQIGDKQFASFLKLNIDKLQLHDAPSHKVTCLAARNEISFKTVAALSFIVALIFNII